MPLVKSPCPSLKKMSRGAHDAESSDPAGDPKEIEREREREREREKEKESYWPRIGHGREKITGRNFVVCAT